jgi:pyrroloquinoline-quinone synthase
MADAVIDRIGLLSNPYFDALKSRMSLDAFRRGQEQFFFAVRYFPRPMAALLSRMPDPLGRLDMLQNIVEEHGDFHPERFHQNTFLTFLDRIGARNPLENGIKMSSAVHAFNSVLMSACLTDPTEVAICTLGIIEYAFATISTLIGQTVSTRGWLSREQMIHYTLHAELDVQHAEEFFVLVESRCDDALGREMIERGLELGGYAFDQLYRGLMQGC